MPDRPLDWTHTYLLGWFGPDGQPYLSSWAGTHQQIEVVVTGYDLTRGPPLWNAPIGHAQLHHIPDEHRTQSSKIAYATSLGGVLAFGWLLDEPVDRTPKK